MTFLILAAALAADEPNYHRDVAPILAKHCTVCHNAAALDDPETSGRLALDSFERVTADKDKQVVRSKKSSQSELLRRLTTSDATKRMPKDERPLSTSEIATFRRWIDAGAPKGEAVETEYRRRESGKKRTLRELVIRLETTAPANALGQHAAGPLSLAAPLEPLAIPTAIAINSDGSRLAVGSHRRIAVWNLKKAAVEFQFLDPAGMVAAVAFSPDGRTLFACGGEAALRGELRAYDLNGGRPAFAMGLSHEILSGLAVDPTGKRVALAGMDRKIRAFDVEAKKEAWSFRGHSDAAWCVAFSKDGKRIVSGGKDKSVKVWNAENGAVEQTITGHRDEVLAAAFLADGATVISGGKESQVRVTKLSQGGRSTLNAGHGAALQHFAWNGDFTKLASAGADRTVRTWRANGVVERTLTAAADVVYSCAVSPDGKTVYGAGGDGVVYVWNVEANRIVARLSVGDAGSAAPGPWMACTANGCVSVSGELIPRSHWIVGAKEIPLDPTHSPLRQLDVVGKALLGVAPSAPAFPAPPTKGPPNMKPTPAKKPAAK